MTTALREEVKGQVASTPWSAGTLSGKDCVWTTKTNDRDTYGAATQREREIAKIKSE